MASSISNKVELMAKILIWCMGSQIVMSKGSIHQEDITTPNLKFNIAPDMYRQN